MLLKISSEIDINRVIIHLYVIIQTINIVISYVTNNTMNVLLITPYNIESARQSLLNIRTADMSSNTFQIGQLIIYKIAQIMLTTVILVFFLRVKANYVYKFNATCMR